MSLTVQTKRQGALNLIIIGRPKAAPVVLAAEIGGPASPSLVALRAIAESAARLGAAAHEVNESLAGPAAKGNLLRQAAGRVLPEIEAHAQKIQDSRTYLKQRIEAAQAAPRLNASSPFFDVMQAFELARAFNAMPEAQRAQTLYAATFDPAGSTWRRALLAVDPVLVPNVTAEQRADLGVAEFASKDLDGFRAMTVEIEQANVVAGGLQRVGDFVSETSAREDWVTHAATASMIAAEPAISWGAGQRVLDTFGGDA